MENTHEMSWSEAKSHARKQANTLRAFETVEAVLAKAEQAERGASEARSARSKAEADRDRLLAESKKLEATSKRRVADATARVDMEETKARKVMEEARADHAALLQSQKKELDAKVQEGAKKLDSLRSDILTRTKELAGLDAKIAAANVALEALRTGLSGVGR